MTASTGLMSTRRQSPVKGSRSGGPPPGSLAPEVIAIRRLAVASLAGYGLALVIIVAGFATNQHLVVGAGFFVGGLATLASLVIRMLLLRPGARSKQRARALPPGMPGGSFSGVAIRVLAALVMLWVGMTFVLRR